MTVEARQWSLKTRPSRHGARRREAAPDHRRRLPQTVLPVEIAFLAAYGIPPSILLKVGAAAEALDVPPEQALLGAGFPEDTFYRILARHLGVPYLDEPLRLAAGAVEGPLAEALGVARLGFNHLGLDILLAPRGPGLRLLLTWIKPAQSRRFAIVSPRCLAALVRQRDKDRLLAGASEGLSHWDSSLSAQAGLCRGQKIVAVSIAVYGGVALTGDWSSAGFVASAAFGLLFMAAVSFNLSALASSTAPTPGPETAIPDFELPVYSVIVPLYREARIVPDLVDALDALDYPRAKLDIKIMVEADDADTIAALERLTLPACYEVMVLPPGRPQTKPRALNYALHFARGALLTVYDAEDRPDPRQLRDAVAAFRRRRSSVACLQAQLSIDHMSESWLTRMFGLEYAALFDVIKPGLAALALPVPLGGTSNHFRIGALRRVGGWDAWNVTEDIDLGFRLARQGYTVETLWSTTFEEAPVTFDKWLPQRSRWLKGWMVTLGVHTRHPVRLFRELGPWSGLAVAAALFGTVLSCLLGPVFITLVALQAWTGTLFRPVTPVGRILDVASLYLLLLGAACTLVPLWLGLKRRRRLDMLIWTPTFPIYLGLVSVAAWRALFELVTEPFSWNKTTHGLSRLRREPGGPKRRRCPAWLRYASS